MALSRGTARLRCAINEGAWNTAIDFVANQSSKLKLIRKKEYDERKRELADEANEASDKAFGARSDAGMAATKKAFDEAKETSTKYSAAPFLSLVVEASEYNGSCVGNLSATVIALLKPSEMIATGKIIYRPIQEIWSSKEVVADRPNTFSSFIIQSSEKMMKSFVNDWALSQREYAD
jgi:hypothetical protein